MIEIATHAAALVFLMPTAGAIALAVLCHEEGEQ